jgi:polysaccharide export outer membrane protein
MIKRTEAASLRTLLLIMILIGSILAAGCARDKGTLNRDSQHQTSLFGQGGLATSGKYRGLVLSDLDNDGSMDVIGGASSPGTVVIWYGDGGGGMSRPQFLPLKGDVRSVAVADFDEDGFKDIVCSVQRESSGIMVWRNRSGRRWMRGAGPIDVNNYQGVETADVNRDGHMDIIAANATSDVQGGIQVWLGDGSGNWVVESGPTVTGTFMDVTLADFNEDGNLDIAGSGWGAQGALKIWFGDGAGSWSSCSSLDKGSFNGLCVGDVNNDGHMDVLAGSYRKGVSIFSGDGAGNFLRAKSPEKEGSFWKVLPVDLDDDGAMDLLAGSIDSKGIKAWKNKGPNKWTPIKGIYPDTGIFYEMVVADLNEDGYKDICVASFGEGIKLRPGSVETAALFKTGEINPVSVSGVETETAVPEENEVFTTISGIPEYKIGPEDILEITMWKGAVGTKELITVRADGELSFGFIDDFYATGRTCSQLDDFITEQLKKYVKNPRIDVVVKEYKSKFVTLMGAVGRTDRRSGSGRIELTGKVTILEIISEAGGLPKDANLSSVRVRRKNGRMFTLNLYKAINHGDTSQDLVMDDGDLVYVPAISKEANRVYVFGEVDKPGVYTFSGSGMSLFDAISEAGGATIFARKESTKVVRGDITRPEVISADLKMLIEEGDQTQNIVLANRDLVYVPRSFIGDANLFVKRIRPLLELILAPARIVNEYDEAYDTLQYNR